MLRLLPFVLLVLSGYAMFYFSSRQTLARLRAQSTSLRDPRIDPYLRKMAAALEIPQIKVSVLDEATVNGLATHDGRIYLTRGFLDQMDLGRVSADEIASVVAHELGHVALGHGPRRMRDFAGQEALRVGLMMVLSRIVPFIGPWIANLVIRLFTAQLSRKDEYEADAYATALLIKSGIGAEPQISLFRKLSTLTGGGQNRVAWTASHPATSDRIAAIEQNALNWR